MNTQKMETETRSRRITMLGSAGFLVMLLTIIACSDDDNPADSGPADTAPPSVSSVTAVDAQHIDVVFNEPLDRSSAEQAVNYSIIEGAGIAQALRESESPGDTLAVWALALKADQRTVSLTVDAMTVVPYDMSIVGVEDASGNGITTPVSKSFTGSTDADVTPPELAYRVPKPNAKDVPIAAPLSLVFSEAITYDSFVGGVDWTSSGGNVPFIVLSYDMGVHIEVVPDSPLQPGTKYTVTLAGLQDESGNTMPSVSWSFTTTSNVDATPPTFVSSSPADGQTQVSIYTDISMTFSEPIDQMEGWISIAPDIVIGDVSWLDGGKTFVIQLAEPLFDDQQYVITILPDGVKDLAGNGIREGVVVRFTTGNALATGRISGILGGDPLSEDANDPTGAYAIAFTEGFFVISGFDVVASNDTYDLTNLDDGVYWPWAIMNSNNNDVLDIDDGDAFGAYGMDLRIYDETEDSVVVAGGGHVGGVNFPLFDPSAITGTLSYDGVHSDGYYYVGIGLFDADDFDPTGEPLFGGYAYWPNDTQWWVHTLDGLPDGRYYIGAYMDVNESSSYEPGIDPAGFYGGDTPTLVWVQKGRDFLNLVIVLEDPSTPTSFQAGAKWPAVKTARYPGLERIREMDTQLSELIESPLHGHGKYVRFTAMPTTRR